MFTISSTNSFLWIKAQVQLVGGWLSPLTFLLLLHQLAHPACQIYMAARKGPMLSKTTDIDPQPQQPA